LISGKAEITSQNHGFVVDQDSLASAVDVELTHVHLNDDTVAGIALKGRPVFSVQFHPEASAGPHDSRYLFDQFVENMERVVVPA
jgi:carbamoyl-phosphate synthase small subunit